MIEILLFLILLSSLARWWLMIKILAQKTRDPLWYAMREMYIIPLIEFQRKIQTAFFLLRSRK